MTWSTVLTHPIVATVVGELILAAILSLARSSRVFLFRHWRLTLSLFLLAVLLSATFVVASDWRMPIIGLLYLILACAFSVLLAQRMSASATTSPMDTYPFCLLVGTWELEYGKKGKEGKEIATIARDGTYSVEGRPTFALAHFDFNIRTNAISFDKIEPGGRNRSTELLNMVHSPLILLGHRVGNPSHKLRYERIAPLLDAKSERQEALPTGSFLGNMSKG